MQPASIVNIVSKIKNLRFERLHMHRIETCRYLQARFRPPAGQHHHALRSTLRDELDTARLAPPKIRRVHPKPRRGGHRDEPRLPEQTTYRIKPRIKFIQWFLHKLINCLLDRLRSEQDAVRSVQQVARGGLGDAASDAVAEVGLVDRRLEPRTAVGEEEEVRACAAVQGPGLDDGCPNEGGDGDERGRATQAALREQMHCVLVELRDAALDAVDAVAVKF